MYVLVLVLSTTMYNHDAVVVLFVICDKNSHGTICFTGIIGWMLPGDNHTHAGTKEALMV